MFAGGFCLLAAGGSPGTVSSLSMHGGAAGSKSSANALIVLKIKSDSIDMRNVTRPDFGPDLH